MGPFRQGEAHGLARDAKDGRPRGAASPGIDQALLGEFDWRAALVAPEARRELPRQIAQEVAAGTTDWGRERRDELMKTSTRGVSAGAIERRIRRILKERRLCPRKWCNTSGPKD